MEWHQFVKFADPRSLVANLCWLPCPCSLDNLVVVAVITLGSAVQHLVTDTLPLSSICPPSQSLIIVRAQVSEQGD